MRNFGALSFAHCWSQRESAGMAMPTLAQIHGFLFACCVFPIGGLFWQQKWLLFLKKREVTGITAQVESMTEPREPLQQPLPRELKSMAKHLVENSLKRACKQGFWCEKAKFRTKITPQISLRKIKQKVTNELLQERREKVFFKEYFFFVFASWISTKNLAKYFIVILGNFTSLDWQKKTNNFVIILSNNCRGVTWCKHFEMISSKHSWGIKCVIHNSPMVRTSKHGFGLYFKKLRQKLHSI